VRDFWQLLAPHADAILACPPRPAEIGIWKSRKNEIFHYCVHQKTAPFIQSLQGYAEGLYWESLPYRFFSEAMLVRGELDGLKLLIMPSPYYLTEEAARSLDAWVQRGGVLLTEAHLAGYNATTGRHSRVLPGCGIASSWGIHETDSTSSYHLDLESSEAFLDAASEDVKKALAATGTSGGYYFPLRLADGTIAWGALRFAVLDSPGWHVEGEFRPGVPGIVSKQIGRGTVFYCASNLGQGAEKDSSGLVALLRNLSTRAGAAPALRVSPAVPGQVHIDALVDDTGLKFLVAVNRSAEPQTLRLNARGVAQGLFSDTRWHLNGETEVVLPGNLTDLFVVS
jgi:hypothetical protein